MRADVRRVLPEQWPQLKALRLEALQDSPVAFCERHVDAVAEPDSTWQARAARGAVGGDSFQVLAWAGARRGGVGSSGSPRRSVRA